MSKILVVDDDVDTLRTFSRLMRDESYQCFTATTREEGLYILEKQNPDLVFLDVKLPKTDGIEYLKKIKQTNKNTEVITITANKDVQTAVKAMKVGAYDYISKPLCKEKIKILIKNILEKKKLSNEVIQLREIFQLNEVVGISQHMQEVFNLVKKVSPYNIAVFLQGEDGTGKELIAHTIHNNSLRADKSFLSIDCDYLTETSNKNELFGYKKEAFSGAERQKLGEFELADAGTLYLSEIGTLPFQVQTKILKVLQEKKIDSSIIAGTNSNLEEEVKKGKFRKDLYELLKEFPVYLPPLRERGEDIVLLVKHFLAEYNQEFNKEIEYVCPHVIDLFKKYSWPGNVNELRNVIRSAVVVCERKTIGVRHLPAEILASFSNLALCEKGIGLHETIFPEGEITSSFKELNKKVEKEYIIRLLNQVDGNKSRAARIMGVDFKTLCSKIQKHNLSHFLHKF